MTLKSEHQMGCAADLGPSAAGTRLANHAAAEGGGRRVHRHQPGTPSEPGGSPSLQHAGRRQRAQGFG